MVTISNLTVQSDGLIGPFIDITMANIVVNCSGEPFAFQSDSGVLEIIKDLANPADCFAKASTKDGVTIFTFTYDGVSKLTSMNNTWGSIDLKKATGSSCTSEELNNA